ncbi:2-hydroxyacid dehydrogenase [Pontibacter vulgaris]|uniref:2-hydroxyacid dehydrogenase n=1 Tax=Pontibacter vulgaris TaxID=2905679 RepID=UPI001FA8179E|nr:glyoxylate/hydroxypyruvate reductase A [Pontibacter vulgaris]
MSITIVNQGRYISHWVNALKEKRPGLDVRVYPDAGSPEEVEFVLSWNHPMGVFKQFPNLKCIASTGAGVDHILKDPELPEQVQITRIVDENLTRDMTMFTTALVLNYMRGLYQYKAAENIKEWKPKRYLTAKDVTIGVMGIGELGASVAGQLSSIGFKVNGWARTEKQLQSINVFAGNAALDDFLATADILICLLPLTKETANILNKSTFSKLPKNAFVINVARGEHLVDNDLIEMIDLGHLAGASLDVFRQEPLPESHPFWAHPKINITPHIASITNPETAVTQILENYDRLQNNQPLLNVVSQTKGY